VSDLIEELVGAELRSLPLRVERLQLRDLSYRDVFALTHRFASKNARAKPFGVALLNSFVFSDLPPSFINQLPCEHTRIGVTGDFFGRLNLP
jgi:hypothetical protein